MRYLPAFALLRQIDPAWLAYRGAYALKRRAGWLRRRTPVSEWRDYSLAVVTGGRSPHDVLAELRRSPLRTPMTLAASAGAIDEIDRALAGQLRFFSGEVRQVGWPPEWHRHPDTRATWPRVHWTHISDRAASDVKWLWELGRFGIAYSLVRAHAHTRDERYAEAFWTLVESWRDGNPPNVGVHWMCGQECAFRVIAWTVGVLALLESSATSETRAAMLVEMMAAHGDRIEANLGYARSQKNNHGVNEALALWTIGMAFPMLLASERWERIGRAGLEEESQRQIYCDGAYVQQSLGYHRLILESFGCAVLWGRRAARPFSDALVARLLKASEFLYQVADPTSGRMPNYGSNDGSRLFRLDGCDAGDARPALALAFRAFAGERVLAPGPWDELSAWISGDLAPASPAPRARVDLAAEEGGYYTLRGGDTWGFLRCGTYRDRPAHADMLHLDLWWRGHNIVADPGTYSYSLPAPWHNGLSSTRVHNTPVVDGLDQMVRGSRFLWFDWNRGRVLRLSHAGEGGTPVIATEQNGYVRRAGVRHRRLIALVADCVWVVVDDLDGPGVHEVSSQWLMPEGCPEGRIDDEAGRSGFRIHHPAGTISIRFNVFPVAAERESNAVVVDAAEGSTYGWFAPTYQHKTPALGLLHSTRARLPLRIVTTIALGSEAVIGSVVAGGLDLTVNGVPAAAQWDDG